MELSILSSVLRSSFIRKISFKLYEFMFLSYLHWTSLIMSSGSDFKLMFIHVISNLLSLYWNMFLVGTYKWFV